MQLMESPSRNVPCGGGGIPAEKCPSVADEDYELPALSPSQRAYAEDPQGFVERLEGRARSLFESGYFAYPTSEAHCFAVVHHMVRAGATDSEYFVRPLDGTCTCPFFAWQAQGEYLTEQSGAGADGDTPYIVPCKHLRGLSRLVRKTRRWLYVTGQIRACCALTLPWTQTLIARRDIRTRDRSNVCVYSNEATLNYRGVRERRKKRPSMPRTTSRKEVSA